MSAEKKKQQELVGLGTKLRKLAPLDFQKVIEDNLTPTKKSYLIIQGVYVSPSQRRTTVARKDFVRDIRKSFRKEFENDRVANVRKKLIAKYLSRKKQQATYRKMLGLKWSMWQRLSRLQSEVQQPQSKIDTDTEEDEVKQFYMQACRPLPGKKQAGKSVLGDTTAYLHKKFNVEARKKVSIRTFQRKRPPTILTVNKNKFQGCMCEYCMNVIYLVRYVNSQYKVITVAKF